MKRIMAAVAVLAVMAGGAWAFAKNKADAPAAAPSASAPAQAQAPAATETVVHTFADEDQMKVFADLWRQRQSVLLRMSVLQSYWNEEQAAIAQLNDKLKQDYQVDPSKSYSLDTKRRVLVERPGEPAAPAAAQPEGAAPASPAPQAPAPAKP